MRFFIDKIKWVFLLFLFLQIPEAVCKHDPNCKMLIAEGKGLEGCAELEAAESVLLWRFTHQTN